MKRRNNPGTFRKVLGSEDQRATGRVQAPGTNHQIEPLGRCPLKSHAHSIPVRFDSDSGIAEHRSNLSLQRLLEEPGEIAAQNADEAVVQELLKDTHVKAIGPAALGVLEAKLLDSLTLALESRQQSHLLDNIEA
jgi:hypothetical protein